MHNARVRTFDADYFIGPTLYETDVSIMNIQELRGILENLSIIEDKLVSHTVSMLIVMESYCQIY